MCEKPIDLDIQRVNALLEKVNASKTQIALGFNRRFDPNFASINSRVKSGEIGNLEQLIIISRDPAPAPKEYIEVSGGIFRDMTIHDFDMARFFVPEIVEVTARGANSFSDYIKEVGDFDSVNVVMRGSNNELITIVNSRHASYGYDQRIEAFGSLGMLTASNQLPTTVRAYSATQTEVADPYLNFFLERYSVAYRQELADFIAGIKNGTNTNPTYEDGRQALILADAALESALTGKSISL
jgi:myo-inositol 2-dehydrogenase/D-chiro-inositol 1-dehydrogenase